MKVVINRCFGGFSLSMKAVARYAELTDRKCYFFKTRRDSENHLKLGEYEPIEMDDDEWMWHAFDIPNPNEVLTPTANWHEMSMPDRRAANELSDKHSIDKRDIKRDDPILVRVVEELKEAANGKFAELSIVEIPEGIEWEIDEYDGMEKIAEVHRTWS